MPYAENEGEEISTELFTARNEGNWSCVMVWECEIVVGMDNWVSTFSLPLYDFMDSLDRITKSDL
jgi:hypothetical protein